MPRFAFALPLRDGRASVLREVAGELLDGRSREHRTFLLSRGIFRERIWLQEGADCVPVIMIMWDCDDIEVAARMGHGMTATAHERWLSERMLGPDFAPGPLRLPDPDVLSGTTIRPTAAAEAQTMFAIPISAERMDGVRSLMAEVESGDLAVHHNAFLERGAVHEEWMWLQPPHEDLPAMLLVHWIGDDLVLAWQRMMGDEADPFARRFADALGLRTRTGAVVTADWQVEQVLAMHVRRTDGGSQTSRLLGTRIGAALSRHRWEWLRTACRPTVTLHDRSSRSVRPEDAITHVREIMQQRDMVVTDTLQSDTQVLATLEDDHGGRLAVLFGVDEGAVTSVRVLVDREPADQAG